MSDLLKAFGERIIELGEPLWRIQEKALAIAKWTTGSEQIRTGNAAAAVQDSGDDASKTEDEEDEDEDADTVRGNNSQPTASDPAELNEVSVAVGRMGVDD